MKIKILSLAIITFSLLGTTVSAQETLLQTNEIPSEIISFVNTHFPDSNILQAEKDREGLDLTYDLILEGNINLEFNSKMEIIDIESKVKLPDSIFSAKILNYIRSNYPENYIIEWVFDEKDWAFGDEQQEFKLNNGLELKFSISGDFLRIDN